MGLLYKDLEKRNDVYDELIDYLKSSINVRKDDANSFYIYEYDNAVELAKSGKKYELNNYLYHGAKGMAIGFGVGAVATQDPTALFWSAVCSGVSFYNYCKYKNMTLGDTLGTKMYFASYLQDLAKENGVFLPFDAGDLEDYSKVEDYVNSLNLEDIEMGDK